MIIIYQFLKRIAIWYRFFATKCSWCQAPRPEGRYDRWAASSWARALQSPSAGALRSGRPRGGMWCSYILPSQDPAAFERFFQDLKMQPHQGLLCSDAASRNVRANCMTQMARNRALRWFEDRCAEVWIPFSCWHSSLEFIQPVRQIEYASGRSAPLFSTPTS